MSVGATNVIQQKKKVHASSSATFSSHHEYQYFTNDIFQQGFTMVAMPFEPPTLIESVINIG